MDSKESIYSLCLSGKSRRFMIKSIKLSTKSLKLAARWQRLYSSKASNNGKISFKAMRKPFAYLKMKILH